MGGRGPEGVGTDREPHFSSGCEQVAVAPSGRGAASCLLQRGLASLPSYVASAPAVTTKKLSNGISVATEVR